MITEINLVITDGFVRVRHSQKKNIVQNFDLINEATY